jgi:hypothetical protein
MQSGDPFCDALNQSGNVSVDRITVRTDGPYRQRGISSCRRKTQVFVFIDLFNHLCAVHLYRARFEITQSAKLLLGLFTEFHTGGGT